MLLMFRLGIYLRKSLGRSRFTDETTPPALLDETCARPFLLVQINGDLQVVLSLRLLTLLFFPCTVASCFFLIRYNRKFSHAVYACLIDGLWHLIGHTGLFKHALSCHGYHLFIITYVTPDEGNCVLQAYWGTLSKPGPLLHSIIFEQHDIAIALGSSVQVFIHTYCMHLSFATFEIL